MVAQLAKSSIDLGVMIADSERSLGFYRDLLGLEHVADTPMPLGGGGTMHRVRCGESLLKLIKLDSVPDQDGSGGLTAATGYRYLTITVLNLTDIVSRCEAAGVPIAMPVTEVASGTLIVMLEDPDGNIVELLQRP